MVWQTVECKRFETHQHTLIPLPYCIDGGDGKADAASDEATADDEAEDEEDNAEEVEGDDAEEETAQESYINVTTNTEDEDVTNAVL